MNCLTAEGTAIPYIPKTDIVYYLPTIYPETVNDFEIVLKEV